MMNCGVMMVSEVSRAEFEELVERVKQLEAESDENEGSKRSEYQTSCNF